MASRCEIKRRSKLIYYYNAIFPTPKMQQDDRQNIAILREFVVY